MALYQKPVRQLMQDMVKDLNLQPGEVLDREQVVEWFETRYPLVKQGTIRAHLIRMSVNAPSRLHHRLRPDGSDDLFFQLPDGRFRLYVAGTDPIPITEGMHVEVEPVADPEPGSSPEASQFAYEHDLRDYLARNLDLLEPGLRLFDDEGITGIEFPAGGRFIDILAIDRSDGLVVVELKVSRGYDRVIGQLLRYMGWIEKHQAEPGQHVRGVIVAKEITEDLKLACSKIADVQLFEYALSFSLKPVAT
jgi:hypothetical protein